MFWATFSMCLAVLVFIMTLLGNRNPRKPKWACDSMVANFWALLIVMLATIGFMMFVFAFSGDARPAVVLDILLSLAAAVGTAVLIKLLGIRKKLAAYAAGRPAEQAPGQACPAAPGDHQSLRM